MTRILLLSAAALLAGCSTLDAALVNRAACTLGGEKKELHVTSFWGRWGITARIHEDDARVACSDAVPVILQVAPRKPGA